MSSLGDDPRLTRNSGDTLTAREEEPVVGRAAQGIGLLAIFAAFGFVALVLFLYLNGRRTAHNDSLVVPATNKSAMAAPPPLNLPSPAPPSMPAPLPAAMPLPAAAPTNVPAPNDVIQRLHAPSVVVDLQPGGNATLPMAVNSAAGQTQITSGAGPAGKAAAEPSDGGVPPASNVAVSTPASALLAGATGGNSGGFNGSFALGGSDATPPTSVAKQMTNLESTVTQGATIPAVMETAINSDLPGYTRAIVSRDVRAFDGKAILIPRGSRVIGQYRSALSLGQSRVFVIWSRVIRPDGVTVQIGSPGGDTLGRGGLDGDVDSHFFSRFGGAILLSVLNAGVTAIAGTPSTQISIGSPAAAAGAAASATVPTGSDILPTITVPQGAAVSIFVARDLDFSNVNPVKMTTIR